MAILGGRRKAREAELAKSVAEATAEAVTKAMSPAMVQGMGGSVASPKQIAGLQPFTQTPGSVAVPLPRLPQMFDSPMGPGDPLLSAPLDIVDPVTGRALPRRYEYQVAQNLNLNDRLPGWATLRSLAEQCDVIHRCIEIRVAELVGMDWDFTISDHAISEIMAKENVGHAKASLLARDRFGEELDRLKMFWENPAPEADITFSEWLTEALYQHYIFDGLAIYPRYNLGRDVIGFEVIDTPTIKVLLDNRGARPQPPAPAYQQILWGFPRGEYQASADSDGEFYSTEGGSGQFIKDQLAYFVRNKRTWTPYGLSAVEQSIPAAMLYLERQAWLQAEYSEGATPVTYFRTDSDELDPVRLASWERVFNDRLAGSTAERHRNKVLPRGFDPVFAPSIDERYKADYDEHLLKMIGSKFGVSPTQLGVVPRTGLGGKGQMQGEQDQAETMSQKPTEQWLIDVVNSLGRRFLGQDRAITFVLASDGNATQAVQQAQANQISLTSGQKTLNTVQGELGQPLYDMPEADEPFIVAGNQVIFIKGLLDENGNGQVSQTEAVANNVGQDPDDAGTQATGEVVPSGGGDVQDVQPAPDATKMAGELAQFQAFVAKRRKSGRWRDFHFEVLDEEQAKTLNAEAAKAVEADHPKADARKMYRAHNI